MKNVIVYLNGERGLVAVRNLLKKKKYKLFVFSDKQIEFYKNNKYLSFFKVNNVNSLAHYKLVKKIKPMVSVVAGFSQILEKKIIDLPIFCTLNLHAGPLPKYRGGSPLNWQIINGEKRIGISILKMDENIDTGDILKSKYFKLEINDDIKIVHKKANNLFANMLTTLLEDITLNRAYAKKQSEKSSQYWHQRNDKDGKIDWSRMTSLEVHNLIRALTKPYLGAYTYLNKAKIRIYKSTLSKKKFLGTPGRVVKIKNNDLFIICSDYGLNINQYEFENNKKLLVNGLHLN